MLFFFFTFFGWQVSQFWHVSSTECDTMTSGGKNWENSDSLFVKSLDNYSVYW